MILKTVTFLCKTISIYWYTTNQGMQNYCKWFNSNHLKKQARLYINHPIESRIKNLQNDNY